MANSSMVAAFESRATEYTVFFIVSVGSTLLLSASVKLVSKSPSSITLHGPLVELVPVPIDRARVMRERRTRDFP